MLHLRTMTKGERDGHLEAIAEALRSNTHITELRCANVSATDFFAEEIADALRSVAVSPSSELCG
eukprot:m.1176480 g.1176480  ORF g.1176480 m.1176480 type:complete len:65 (+) comp24521_c0_seq105:9037-9231(+)